MDNREFHIVMDREMAAFIDNLLVETILNLTRSGEEGTDELAQRLVKVRHQVRYQREKHFPAIVSPINGPEDAPYDSSWN